MNESVQQDLKFKVQGHIDILYPTSDSSTLSDRLITLMDLDSCHYSPPGHANNWNEQDAWLITYGDSITGDTHAPLAYLKTFLNEQLKGVINGVHILPFYPYSSDDGFSVIDYSQVNDGLGGWEHIESIASEFHLMADLVINHCSSRSRWFDNYKQRKSPGLNYFVEASPLDDLSKVVRPRTSPLLREVQTLDGKRYVWCTFSHDQVDLNFENPDVLCEFITIIRLYLNRGVRIFRLDAVAFLWKEEGTTCIHHFKTHEMIRLIRTLVEHAEPRAIIITETNVPNHENLSYFGNANEAHAIYNFSLPPLVLHALVAGTSTHLKAWQMSMPPAQMGTFYFNFIASHDGIGLRPAEGLLCEEQIHQLVNTMQRYGGRISWRVGEGAQNKPYEINITLFDALQGTHAGPDQWHMARYLCAHAIMLALEGIPAIYIHSLLGTNNDEQGVQHTQRNRSINRYKWDFYALKAELNDPDSHHHQVFSQLKVLLAIRRVQPAFHPNAVQFTLHLGEEVFGFWRQNARRDQSIFCLHNVTDQQVVLPLSSLNLISLDAWVDLVSGQAYTDIRQEVVLAPYQFVWLTNKKHSTDA